MKFYQDRASRWISYILWIDDDLQHAFAPCSADFVDRDLDQGIPVCRRNFGQCTFKDQYSYREMFAVGIFEFTVFFPHIHGGPDQIVIISSPVIRRSRKRE